ncbi:unnamed protein product [Schistosoma curassoni]|nr:unnamed protein product [Schistosoma curassoni]
MNVAIRILRTTCRLSLRSKGNGHMTNPFDKSTIDILTINNLTSMNRFALLHSNQNITTQTINVDFRNVNDFVSDLQCGDQFIHTFG